MLLPPCYYERSNFSFLRQFWNFRAHLPFSENVAVPSNQEIYLKATDTLRVDYVTPFCVTNNSSTYGAFHRRGFTTQVLLPINFLVCLDRLPTCLDCPKANSIEDDAWACLANLPLRSKRHRNQWRVFGFERFVNGSVSPKNNWSRKQKPADTGKGTITECFCLFENRIHY